MRAITRETGCERKRRNTSLSRRSSFVRAFIRGTVRAPQLVACVACRHGSGLPAPGDLELGEAGPSSGQDLRAAYAPGVAGEPALATALMRLAMARADMAKIRSSGSASAGLMRCRQAAVSAVR